LDIDGDSEDDGNRSESVDVQSYSGKWTLLHYDGLLIMNLKDNEQKRCAATIVEW